MNKRSSWLLNLWRKFFPEKVTLLSGEDGKRRRVTKQQIIRQIFKAALATARRNPYRTSDDLGLAVEATVDFMNEDYRRWQASQGVAWGLRRDLPWDAELWRVANQATSLMQAYYQRNPPPLLDSREMVRWKGGWDKQVIPQLIKLAEKHGIKV